jgi:ABC-type proline/glycine betaine transport system permease subunit
VIVLQQQLCVIACVDPLTVDTATAGSVTPTTGTGDPLARLDVGMGFESGLCVVLLAIILDRLTQSFGARRAA